MTLVDPLTGQPARDGEICLDLSPRPLGLMTGYLDDPALNAAAMRGGHYHTGDVATSDEDGYITYVGRTDDVFKASDYRISPFELESILIEHEAVAEAAVVPSPDPVRLAVPKACILLTATREPSPELARSIMAFCRERVAPYKRIRWIEFADLPRRSPARSAGSSSATRRPPARLLPRHRRILGGRLHLVIARAPRAACRVGCAACRFNGCGTLPALLDRVPQPCAAYGCGGGQARLSRYLTGLVSISSTLRITSSRPPEAHCGGSMRSAPCVAADRTLGSPPRA
jgi:hypothetical protein